MTTIIELERKVKTANAKIYALENERSILIRRLQDLENELLNLKTPKQLIKEKKNRETTLKKIEVESIDSEIINADNSN
jgi:hypothetical protein